MNSVHQTLPRTFKIEFDIIDTLKALFNDAVRSGKIVYLGPKHKFRQDEDFTLFRKQLAPIEWKQFEEKEFFSETHCLEKS